MSDVVLPPKPLLVPAFKKTINQVWWFLGLVVPGLPLAFKGQKLRTKILGWFFITIFLATIASSVYIYMMYGLKDAGIWVASDPTRLTYTFIIIASVLATLLIGHTLSTSYLVRKGSWKLPTKVIYSTLSTIIVGSMLAGVAYAGHTVNTLNDTLISLAEEAVEFTPPEFEEGSMSKPVEDTGPVWGDSKRVNIMVLGSDAGPDRSGIRPDILMVVSINTETGNAQLFNVPRNLIGAKFPEDTPAAKVFPSGFSSHEGILNAVWAWGSSRPDLYPGSSNPGLTATRDVLTEMFGLDIQHYLVLNLKGFEDFVNLMGGVTLNIPRDIPYNDGRLAIAAGDNQHLNGEKALWFARERYTNTDYDRMQRQRCVVGALVDQITPTKIIAKSNELMGVLKDNMFTNLKQEDLKDWVSLLEKVQNANLNGFSFVPPEINPATPDLDFIRSKVQGIVVADDALNVTAGEPTVNPVVPQPVQTDTPSSPQDPATPTTPEGTPPPAVDTGYENPYCGT